MDHRANAVEGFTIVTSAFKDWHARIVVEGGVEVEQLEERDWIERSMRQPSRPQIREKPRGQLR